MAERTRGSSAGNTPSPGPGAVRLRDVAPSERTLSGRDQVVPARAATPVRHRRPDRALPGTDTTARGDIPRTRPLPAGPHFPLEPTREPPCNAARSSFGIASYTASRTSRCRNRYASSSPRSPRSGRMRSLRRRALDLIAHRAGQLLARESFFSPTTRRTPCRSNPAARSITARSTGHQAVESSRDQSLDRRRHLDLGQMHRRRSTGRPLAPGDRSSISIATISSTNSGLPSAASATRVDTSPTASGSPIRSATSWTVSASVKGSR